MSLTMCTVHYIGTCVKFYVYHTHVSVVGANLVYVYHMLHPHSVLIYSNRPLWKIFENVANFIHLFWEAI